MPFNISCPEKPCQNPDCKATAIYQCPRCQFRSCSLACCQAHKQRTKCNGKRDRTQYMPMHKMSDETLTSDYFFLEDVMRQVKKPRLSQPIHTSTEQPTTHPLLQKVDPSSSDRFQRLPHQLPQKTKKLIQAAASRGTRVLIQPAALSRHQENKSYVNKEGTIYWSVEIINYIEGRDSEDKQREQKERLLRGPVAETSRLGDVVPTTPSSAACYCIRRFPSNTYRPVNLDSTWKETLQDITVIEFPTIYIGPKAKFSLSIEEVES